MGQACLKEVKPCAALQDLRHRLCLPKSVLGPCHESFGQAGKHRSLEKKPGVDNIAGHIGAGGQTGNIL